MDTQSPGAESSHRYNRPGRQALQHSVSGGRRSVALVFTLPRYDDDVVADLLALVRRQRPVSDIVLVVAEPDAALQNGMFNGLDSPRQRVRLVSGHSQRLAALDVAMEEAELPLPPHSLIRGLWYALGYLLTASRADVVAVCAEKVAEQPQVLTALLHPLLSPGNGFQLSKVCPSRSINNDPEAALLAPFVEALNEVFATSNDLQCLARFTSPLSDGLAFRRNLVGNLRLPVVDNLQLALLAEIQRRLAVHNLHQMEYQPHSPMSLSAMATGRGATADGKGATGWKYDELVTVLLDTVRSEGTVLGIEALQTVKLNFQEKALDCLTARRSDCAINGLEFNEHEAERLIEHFAEIVFTTGCEFIHGRRALSRLPSWKRASHALPDLLAALRHAIDEDFAELSESVILIPPSPDQHPSYIRP